MAEDERSSDTAETLKIKLFTLDETMYWGSDGTPSVITPTPAQPRGARYRTRRQCFRHDGSHEAGFERLIKTLLDNVQHAVGRDGEVVVVNEGVTTSLVEYEQQSRDAPSTCDGVPSNETVVVDDLRTKADKLLRERINEACCSCGDNQSDNEADVSSRRCLAVTDRATFKRLVNLFWTTYQNIINSYAIITMAAATESDGNNVTIQRLLTPEDERFIESVFHECLRMADVYLFRFIILVITVLSVKAQQITTVIDHRQSTCPAVYTQDQQLAHILNCETTAASLGFGLKPH